MNDRLRMDLGDPHFREHRALYADGAVEIVVRSPGSCGWKAVDRAHERSAYFPRRLDGQIRRAARKLIEQFLIRKTTGDDRRDFLVKPSDRGPGPAPDRRHAGAMRPKVVSRRLTCVGGRGSCCSAATIADQRVETRGVENRPDPLGGRHLSRNSRPSVLPAQQSLSGRLAVALVPTPVRWGRRGSPRSARPPARRRAAGRTRTPTSSGSRRPAAAGPACGRGSSSRSRRGSRRGGRRSSSRRWRTRSAGR